jgi:hypothetical protein
VEKFTGFFSEKHRHEHSRADHFSWNMEDVDDQADDVGIGFQEDARSYYDTTIEPHHIDHFARHIASFDQDHRHAIARYKGNSTLHYNQDLRRKTSIDDGKIWVHPEAKRRIDKLDYVTGGVHTVSPLTVYRGFGKNFDIENLHEGSSFQDRGYTSTTLQKHIATDFSRFTNRRHVVAQIEIPKGTRAFHMDQVPNDLDHEHEMTLHRGSIFQVMGHSHHDFRHVLPGLPPGMDSVEHRLHVVHMKVIGQEPHPVRSAT